MPIAKAPVENSANYRVTDKLNKACLALPFSES